MPRIKAGEIEINYEVEGRGDALVFINGITMDTNGWGYQAPFFSQIFQSHKIRLPGTGAFIQTRGTIFSADACR